MTRTHNASIATCWLQLVIDTAKSINIDIETLVNEVGLSMEVLDDPKGRVNVLALLKLWSHISKQIPDQNFGLLLGERMSIRYLDSVGFSILSSSTVKDALESLIEFEDIICDGTSHKLIKNNDNFELNFNLIDTDFRNAPQFIDAMITSTFVIACWLCHKEFKPTLVRFKHSPYGAEEEYARIFQCPIEFNAERNSILIEENVLAQPLATANTMMADVYQHINKQTLKQFKREEPTKQLSSKVRDKLISELPTGEPSVESIANFFNMSLRTFQRRLKEEGWSYIRLLDDTRKVMAKHYLSEDALSLQETSFLLGFSDSSIFSRAFKRWYSLTPIQYVDQRKNTQTA